MQKRINRHDLYYLLGFGFLDFQAKDQFTMVKPRNFRKTLEDLSFVLFDKDNVEGIKEDRKWVTPSTSLKIDNDDVIQFLQQNGVTTPKRYMPSIVEEFAWSFIAGYFDAYGEFSVKGMNPRVFVQSSIPGVIDFISKYWQVKTTYSDKVLANGYKALDICYYMYKDVSIKNNTYLDLVNIRQDKPMVSKSCQFEYVKLHPLAREPQKTYATDSGYDLHIVELTKLYDTPWGASVYQGKTGLAIKPVLGYAFDINGRSSLPKSGWELMQGTGICDRSYTGEIQGTFMKMNDSPMPEMPWKALQAVPREAPLHTDWVERKDLGESFRGTGGFGSTNGR